MHAKSLPHNEHGYKNIRLQLACLTLSSAGIPICVM